MRSFGDNGGVVVVLALARVPRVLLPFLFAAIVVDYHVRRLFSRKR